MVVAVVGVFQPGRAAAADGYTLTSTSTYQFDPANDAVLVATLYEMTNTTPDRRAANGRLEYFFFTGTSVPIHAGAHDIVVAVDGRPAEYEMTAGAEFAMLAIEFDSDLRLGEKTRIAVHYELRGEPPRSETSWVRVNPAYVSFPVIAFADPGSAWITIDIPSDWTPDYTGHELMSTVQDDRLLLEAYELAAPDEFYLQFTARQDHLLASVHLTVAGSAFELRAWPGDMRWTQFASHHVEEGLPILERLTGTPWPEENETDVIESSTPYLRGYAGYYFADTDVIEVTEDLDGHTILHELSHAWFNDAYLSDRWLSEGLADAIAARAVAELGEPLPVPDDYDLPPGFDPGQFELNAWDRPADEIDDGLETYGYQTSFRVMHELIDEIGEEKMTELVAAVLRGDRAYGPEDGDPIDDGAVDWREFLDLAEQIGGSTELDADYREHVVSAAEATDLDARRQALDRYAELVDRGGTWGAPEAVRQRMSAWLFDAAESRIVEAEAALEVRDVLSEELSHVDLAPTSQIEQQYQDTDDLEAVVTELTEQLAAARRIVAGRAAMTEQLDTLSLEAPALTQTDYEESPLELAAGTEQLAEQAGQLAEADQHLDRTLATFALSVPELEPDAFAASPELAADTLDDYQQAADAVVEAHLARDAAASVAERVGEVGSDAEKRLTAAVAALAAGDAAGAIDNARAATAEIDHWESRGRARIAGAILVVAAILLLVLLVLVVRRRRRRRRMNAGPIAGDRDTAETDPTTELRQTWPDDGADGLDDGLGGLDGRGDDAVARVAADPADARQVGAVDSDR